jgi:WD40 repeat protein
MERPAPIHSSWVTLRELESTHIAEPMARTVVPRENGRMLAARIRADEQSAVVVTDRDVEITHWSDGGLVERCCAGRDREAAAVSSDARFAAVSVRGSVEVWDLGRKTLVARHEFPSTPVALAFSPDAETLAVGGGRVSLWSWKSNIGRVTEMAATGYALAFAPDGDHLQRAKPYLSDNEQRAIRDGVGEY